MEILISSFCCYGNYDSIFSLLWKLWQHGFVAMDTYRCPFSLHLVHSFLQRVFLTSCLTDGLELWYKLVEVHVDEAREAVAVVRLQRVSDDLRDGLPMTFPQTRVEQGTNHRHVLPEFFYLSLHLLKQWNINILIIITTTTAKW